MSMLTIHQRFSLQLLFFFFFFNLYLYTADVKVCRQEAFFSCSSCYFFLFPFSLYLYSACRSLPYSSVFPYKSCFFDPYLYSGCQKAFFLTSLVSSFKHLFAGCQSSPKTSVVSSDKSC